MDSTIFQLLVDTCPCFSVDSDRLSIFDTPSHFYDELLKRSRLSKKRIILSSLYIGIFLYMYIQSIHLYMYINYFLNIFMVLFRNPICFTRLFAFIDYLFVLFN